MALDPLEVEAEPSKIKTVFRWLRLLGGVVIAAIVVNLTLNALGVGASLPRDVGLGLLAGGVTTYFALKSGLIGRSRKD